MRALVRRHKILTAVIGLFALLVALVEVWSVTAQMRGRIAAHFDVRHGHYKLLVYGLPPTWRSEYSRLLKERYGIETDIVAFCIVSDTLRSYANSYDEV